MYNLEQLIYQNDFRQAWLNKQKDDIRKTLERFLKSENYLNCKVSDYELKDKTLLYIGFMHNNVYIKRMYTTEQLNKFIKNETKNL